MYPLKKVIIENDLGFAIPVTGWKDTWKKLKLHISTPQREITTVSG